MSAGWFTRSASSAALPARQSVRGKVHGRNHVPGPRPAIEQIRVGPAALREPRREKQQRERTAGLRGADRDLTPGQRVGDRRQQRACAERLARHAGVRGLGECHLALADPVGSRDADTRARARLADHRLGGDLRVCRLGRDRMGSGGPGRLRLFRAPAGAADRRDDHNRNEKVRRAGRDHLTAWIWVVWATRRWAES